MTIIFEQPLSPLKLFNGLLIAPTCIALLLLTITVDALKDEFTELIFKNQELCGNPFSDAQWIPVLDMCTIKCDEFTELCVGDEQLKQQCNKLPESCIRLIKSIEKKSKRIYIRGMDRAKVRTVPLLTKRKSNDHKITRGRSLPQRRVNPIIKQKQIGKTIW